MRRYITPPQEFDNRFYSPKRAEQTGANKICDIKAVKCGTYTGCIIKSRYYRKSNNTLNYGNLVWLHRGDTVTIDMETKYDFIDEGLERKTDYRRMYTIPTIGARK